MRQKIRKRYFSKERISGLGDIIKDIPDFATKVECNFTNKELQKLKGTYYETWRYDYGKRNQ